MKGKLLVLGVAVTLLGSIALGGAFSFSPLPDSDVSDLVHVCDLATGADAATVDLAQIDGEIPANGAYHQVDDIKVQENDDCYTYHVTLLEVTDEGTDNGDCDTWDYALTIAGGDSQVANSAVPDAPIAPLDIGNLYLKVDNTANTLETCAISGGEVTATFAVP
jgi:hypothetical protein